MSAVERRLTRAWLSRGPLALALWPASLAYGLAMALRRLAYRLGWRRGLPVGVPVVVVGNVLAGGTGKTPVVMAIVRHLRDRGWQPGVVSRGYGRAGAATGDDRALPTGVHPDDPSAPDEPLLLARQSGVPVWIGRDRVAAALALRRAHPEVDIVVSDDGMQHWALARDLTLVVFDERGLGNGWLLPAGPLRERWPAQPWGPGAMLVLQTCSAEHDVAAASGQAVPGSPDGQGPHRAGASAVGLVKGVQWQAQRVLATEVHDLQGRALPLAELLRQEAPPLAAVAGIARPQRFFDMLQAVCERHGRRLDRCVALEDHASAAALRAACQPGWRWLCTDKDAVKLRVAPGPGGAGSGASANPGSDEHPPPADIWSVGMGLRIDRAFWQALDDALPPRQRLSSTHGSQAA